MPTSAVVGTSTLTAAVARPSCKYGKDCYRQSEEHWSSFAHPGDDDWASADGGQNHVDQECQIDATAANTLTFIVDPPWLAPMTSSQSKDLKSDLQHMASKFNLDKAEIVEEVVEGGLWKFIELEASDCNLLDDAKQELTRDDGLLAYYHGQVSGASSVNEADSQHCAEEVRIDPENGQACTLWDLTQIYQDKYSEDDIWEYWQGMQPT